MRALYILFVSICYASAQPFMISDPATVGASGWRWPAGGNLPTNLVSYWKLDDGSDSVGTNTLASNGSPTFAAGFIDNGITTSSGNYLYRTVQAGGSLDITNNITISAWVKLTGGTASAHGIVSRFTGGSYVLYYANNVEGFTFLVYNQSDAVAYVRSFTTTTTNVWHFVAGRYDGTNLRLRVNATDITPVSHTTGIKSTSATLSIGADPDTFPGGIDEVGIWNRALTDAELTELYNSGSGKTYPF